MKFSISDGRLTSGGVGVPLVPSPHIGAPFAAPPRIAVIHFTAGASARSSAEWFRTPRPNGSSAHVVIDRDGSVIQCVAFDRIAWHAGASRWGALVGLNAFSFGIELANWGYLRAAGSGWASPAGKRIADPVLAVHRHGNPDGTTQAIGWEPYPEAQCAAAAAVVRALAESYEVDQIVGHDDIAPTRKWDPGPAFDMAAFRQRVFGGRAAHSDIRVKVAAANGLNLRAGPGTSFGALETMPKGTALEPLAAQGSWMEVSVIAVSGAPRATGWVHRHYVAEM